MNGTKSIKHHEQISLFEIRETKAFNHQLTLSKIFS